MAIELPKAYDPKAAQEKWLSFWDERGYFHSEPAVHDRHPAAQRHRRAAHGARAQQHAAGRAHPLAAHAGLQRPVDARHRPRRHRHAGGGRAALRRGEEDPPRPRPRGAGQAHLAVEGQYEKRILGQLKQLGCKLRLAAHALHARRGLRPGRARDLLQAVPRRLIFRGKRLVNWDTHLQTAVADDETYTRKSRADFWTFKYPGGRRTDEPTRQAPSSSLQHHAARDDARRHRRLRASERRALQAPDRQEVTIPLNGREIPIIADGLLADPELGTGCVKVTPAHDPNDYACGLRNPDRMINILNPDGTINENGGKYAGLDRYKAAAVVAEMERSASSRRSKTARSRSNYSDRSKTPIEPYLSDQWFVKMGRPRDGKPGSQMRWP
jgi:valyl-tRNA synthetase